MNKIIQVIRFEMKHTLKTASVWVFAVLLFLLSFFTIHVIGGAFDGFQVMISGENTKINSPFFISLLYSVISIAGVVVVAVIAGRIPLKDMEFNSLSQAYTLPLQKAEHVLGKYIAALLICLFIFSFAAFGIFIGGLMPYLDSKLFGPFEFGNYFFPFVQKICINVFFLSAFFFSLGLMFRSMFVNWLGVIVLYAFYYMGMSYVSKYNHQALAALLDPFGLAGSFSVSIGQSSDQLNNNKQDANNLVLYNRIVWSTIGLICLFVAYVKFEFKYNLKSFSLKKTKTAPPLKNTYAYTISSTKIQSCTTTHSLTTSIKQFLFLVKHEFLLLFRNFYFRITLLVGLAIVLLSSMAIGKIYDTEIYPLTYSVTDLFIGATGLFIFVVVVLFSGEMVWRDRSLNTFLVNDALPVNTSIRLGSKITAMIITLLIIYAALIPIGILVQCLKDYHTYETTVYIKNLIGIRFVNSLFLVFFAFAVQAFSPNRFMGYFILLLYYVWNNYFAASALEHNLLVFNSSPSMLYSDMNGFGYQVLAFALFKLYWLLFAVLLLIPANRFYPQGIEIGFKNRWGKLRKAFQQKKYRFIFLSFSSLFFILASFLFYNFNVLNEFSTSYTAEKTSADYEKKYASLKYKEQPVITSVKVNAELFPEKGLFSAEVEYTLTNISSAPIQEVYLHSNAELITGLAFSRANTPVFKDADCDFYSYRLSPALKPGDSIRLNFHAEDQPKGISNQGVSTLVDKNGTFMNSDVFPKIGYNTDLELSTNRIRRKHGLPELNNFALKQNDARGIARNMLGGKSLVRFELTAGTDKGQVILAPGDLCGEWAKKGRSYFKYKSSRPINNFYSILSAKYTVEKSYWVAEGAKPDTVQLAVYHHPPHSYNLTTMLNGMKESLSYYSKYFSPFQYKTLRIVEFPRYSLFAQSFPGNIPFSEGIGFVADLRGVNMDSSTLLKDENTKIDYPFYVTAHEVAHQWWAHQLCAADVEGNAFLMETLSQYSALMVMKQHYGEQKMRKFLNLEAFSYLSSRGKENHEEQPLLNVLPDQTEVFYRKGSVIMYALQDYIGEDTVNKVLSRFLNKYAFKNAPYPTAQELINEFDKATPDSLQYIVEDWFKQVTLYQNKVLEASYKRSDELEYSVSFSTDIHKFHYNKSGKEAEVGVNDYIEVGVYNIKGKEVYLKKLKMKKGKNEFTIHLGRKPEFLVIDPYNKLLDKDWNMKKIKVEQAKNQN